MKSVYGAFFTENMSSMMMLYSNPSSSKIIATFHGFGELGNAGVELVDEEWLVGELRRWVRGKDRWSIDLLVFWRELPMVPCFACKTKLNSCGKT